jgi:hypothetical protein
MVNATAHDKEQTKDQTPQAKVKVSWINNCLDSPQATVSRFTGCRFYFWSGGG